MAQIELDDVTYERLLVTARLLDEPVGQVVHRLLDRLTSDGSPAAPPGCTPAPDPASYPGPKEEHVTERTLTAVWIPVHKIYKGQRVEGTFNPSTHEIRLTTPPFANRYFNSPTGACRRRRRALLGRLQDDQQHKRPQVLALGLDAQGPPLDHR